MQLRVQSVTFEAEGILSFKLVDPVGRDLPKFEAGAHVDVEVPGGFTRQYSLCDGAWLRDHYRIAVLNVTNGRGGSQSLHTRVHAGDLIAVSEPRNLFPLAIEAKHSVLLAGGIGITPLLSMLEHLRRTEQSYELHYCTQNVARTPFLRRLAPEIKAGRARLYHDGGDPRKGLNIAALLRPTTEGTHVYYCGPTGFMAAARQAAEHWQPGTVHFEHFGPTPQPRTALNGAGNEIVLARSQRRIAIDCGQTILQALRGAGVECASSCEAGMCGTCRLNYSSGRIDHNDLLLSDEERASSVLICCAQIAEGPVVIDL